MTGLYPTENRFVTYYSKAETDQLEFQTFLRGLSNMGIPRFRMEKSIMIGMTALLLGIKYFAQRTMIYHLPENLALPEKLQPAFEGADVDDMAYAGGPVVQETIADLRALKQAGNPFFLAVGIYQAHLPFNGQRNIGIFMIEQLLS